MTAHEIKLLVANHFGQSLADFDSQSRKQPLAFHRQMAMTLMVEHTDLTQSAVGQHFGDRDHGTVLHAIRLVNDRRHTEPKIAAEWDNLARTITATMSGPARQPSRLPSNRRVRYPYTP